MAGAGKSHWSKKLEKESFTRISCNELIGQDLAGILKKSGDTTFNLAKWMGHPYEEGYKEKSKKYLELEKNAVKKIHKLLTHMVNENVVIDTTGSIIYLDNKLLKLLKNKTRVIWLDTPRRVLKEMYSAFLKKPKPIIWGSSFTQKPNELPDKALTRSYKHLLYFRLKKYKELAHMRFDYEVLRSKDFTVKNFIDALKFKHPHVIK